MSAEQKSDGGLSGSLPARKRTGRNAAGAGSDFGLCGTQGNALSWEGYDVGGKSFDEGMDAGGDASGGVRQD